MTPLHEIPWLGQKENSPCPYGWTSINTLKGFCCFETRDWFSDSDLYTNMPGLLALFHNHKPVQVGA